MKKTVPFAEFIRWENHPTGAVQAILRGVKNHYRLGDVDHSDVITSAVVRIDYAANSCSRVPVEIETLNTIYVQAGE